QQKEHLTRELSLFGKAIDVRKVPPQLVVVQAVAHDKDWLDFDPDVVELDCTSVHRRLRQERRHCNGGGRKRTEMVANCTDGGATVGNIFDDEHIPFAHALERPIERNCTAAGHRSSIAGGTHKFELE